MRQNILAILAVTLASFFLSASAAYCATVRVPENYKTIQTAVNNAADNDLIIIGKGSYKENVVIKKPLQIRGSKGAEATIITAANKTEPVFKIDDASYVFISGITATGSDSAGIELRNTSFCRIANNIFTRNANGLMSYASNKNAISENIASFNAQYGIYLETSNYNDVSYNTADSNGDKGILLSSSSANVVVENEANLNTWNGIVLWASHGNQIKENRALRNTYAMVMGDSDDNDVSGNSTWPNLFVILPIILVYLGIVNYLVQKNIMRLVYKGR